MEYLTQKMQGLEVRDEVFIANVNGGLALYGVAIGWEDGTETRKKPMTQVLAPPHDCKLKPSALQFRVDTYKFSSLVECEMFWDELNQSGWSVASRLVAPAGLVAVSPVGGEVGVGVTSTKALKKGKSKHEQATEAFELYCQYVPKASFQIHHTEIRLSDHVLADAQGLQTLADAEKFLQRYGSHIPKREYHVGGVLVRSLNSVTGNKSDRSHTKASTRNVLGLSAAISIPTAEVSGTGSAEKNQASSLWSKDDASTLEARALVRTIGPATADEEEFMQQLERDRSTWCVIDSTEDVTDNVPIWKLLKKHESEVVKLDKQIRLLRVAWKRSLAFLGHQRSLKYPDKKKWSAVPPEEVQCLEKSELIQQLHYWVLSVLYDEECNFPELQLLQPREIIQKLGEICVTIGQDWVNMVEHDITPLLFKTRSFMNLVNYIAESFDEAMEKAKKNLCRILNNVQHLLRDEGITLSKSVQAMLDLEAQNTEVVVLAPLEEVISPDRLPAYLTELVENHSKIPEDMKSQAVFTSHVEGTIRACLSKHQSNEVRNVVVKYGFNEEGLWEYHLSRSHFENMIKDLKDSLVPQTNRTSSMELPAGYNIALQPFCFPSEEILTYNRDIVVDRPFEKTNPHKRLIDCIRHRMNPFSSTSTAATESDDANLDSWDDGDDSELLAEESASGSEGLTNNTSPFHLVVQIMKSSDLTFQMTLCKMLLEQRYAVPLVLAQNGLIPEMRLRNVLSSLRGVEVKVGDQKTVSICSNIAIPCVFFVSMRKSLSLRETAAMASDVLGCHFVSQYCNGDVDTDSAVELGIGFCPASQLPNQHFPCLAFCIWGDFQQFAKFVNQTADVIIIERDAGVGPKPSLQGLPNSIKYLYWEANSSQNGVNKKTSDLWGSFKYVANILRTFLRIQCPREHNSLGRPALLEECLNSVHSMHPPRPARRSKVDEDEMVKAFTTPKSALQLQESYAREAHFYFDAIKFRNNPPEQTARERACQEEIRKREILAAEVSDLPVVKLFLKLLSQEDPVDRRLSITELQRSFDKRNKESSEQTGKQSDIAFGHFQSTPQDSLGYKMLQDAKVQNLKKMLGFENVWRELCHIFIADPRKKNIPILAAYYLLDGFPLEILDGEAGMYCNPWVDTVLFELNKLLTQHLKHEPKVFVLSVVGLQSSGKSTLLNTMFGSQLHTGAGRCTKGVYLQLVKSDRQEYDYVLLLDTEGIRAPEFFGDENAELHDNRLATFSVLPADACVVVVSNEDDSGLKDVLSMVMLAYKGSAIAIHSGGWMPSQLFFVYRSVDTNDCNRLRTNRQKLQEHLQKAALEAAGTKLGGGTEEQEPESASIEYKQVTGEAINSVTNFRVSEQEDLSDVKYLGNLKKENMPPGDTPDWAYGTKVMEVREYIHKRVIERENWHPHNLTDWGTYLGLVWKCIAQANFELNFKSLVEFSAYEELSNILEKYRRVITKRYDEQFETFEQQLRHNRTGTDGRDRMLSEVDEIIKKQTKEVELLLQNPRWQKWKIQELTNWREYLRESRYHWSGRCEDAMDFLKSDNVVRENYQKIQRSIVALLKSGQLVLDQNNVEKKRAQLDAGFDNLFQRILQEVRSHHNPRANEVPRSVTTVYNRENIETSEIKTPSLLPTMSHSSRASPRQYQLDEELRRMVDRILADVNTYSDRCVQEVITATKTIIKTRASEHLNWRSRQKREDTHSAVKAYVKERLQKIQQDWDAEHNVFKKFEQERHRLRQFFEDCANEVSGSELLAQAIVDMMQIDSRLRIAGGKSMTEEAFKAEFIKQASIKLEREAWVSSGVGFRALLDLHLLNIVDKEKVRGIEFLPWVADGCQHYEFIMNTLIERELTSMWQKDNPWICFITKVNQALRLAVVAADSVAYKGSGLRVFLETFQRQIGATVSQVLANTITHVTPDFYDPCNLDYNVVESSILSRINDFKLSLNAGLIKDLGKGVRERLAKLENKSASSRCPESCPKCTLTCFKETNHSGLHDTVHQPKGLAGYVLMSEKSKCHHELSATSCARAVQVGQTWIKNKNERSMFHSKYAKYSNFNKYHPTWKVPSNSGEYASQVREYIFYNFQNEIVKMNPGAKVCTHIPVRYNHNPLGLRLELEGILQKEGIKFDDSRTFI